MEPSELFSKALALHQEGEIAEAIALYRKLLCLRPDASGVLGLMGTALSQEGAHANAIHALKRALTINPTHAATYSNLGLAQKDSKHLTEALESQKKSLVLDPAFFDGLRNLAATLRTLNQAHEALPFAGFALRLSPQNHEALALKGVLHGALHHMSKATEIHTIAVLLHPAHAEALNNLGAALLQSMKISAALTVIQRSLCVQPKNVEGWLNLGALILRLGHYDRALEAFNSAITLKPGEAGGYMGRAAALKADRKFRLAAMDFERANQVTPDKTGVLGQTLYCWSQGFEWGHIEGLMAMLKRDIANGLSIANPFPLLTLLDNPQVHLLAARRHAQETYPGTASEFPQGRQTDHGKIRIGYFTSDLQPLHPVFKNLYPLLTQHDRSRFALFCFDNSTTGEIAVPQLFDACVHIRSMSDQEVAALSREKGIDIAIDLNGYTEDARTDVFAARAAPIQINYLGYPGSMGTTYHDFILADDYVIPSGSEPFYSEKVLRLPPFFMPYDLQSNRPQNSSKARRGDYGLPEGAFIYCSFNDFHKITEATFKIWTRILQGTDNTVLWLARRGEIGIDAIKSMLQEAGVDPERVIEAQRVESPQEHHARLALADLMLDTFPYNSHTTACDAISVGLPLLTRSGKSFASRVSGSLLSAAKLDCLITQSDAEYLETAIALAKDPQRYMAIRQRVLDAPHQMPSTQAYTTAFEALMASLVAEHRSKLHRSRSGLLTF